MAADGRHIDVLARVELKGRFSAVDFDVQLRVWMSELSQHFERLSARVQRHLARVRFHDEAIVELLVGRVEGERFGNLSRERFHLAQWDSVGVDRQVFVGRQLGLGAFDVSVFGKVKITTSVLSVWWFFFFL